MRSIVALALALFTVFAAPLQAREVVYVVTVVEEWVEGSGSDRLVEAQPAVVPHAIATFGPFRVVDGTRAALVGATDRASPAQFAAMLRAFPAISSLDMVECPGTDDDSANLKLGRMIRAAGIATHVPAGGSVRSGAVELFLAGATRRIEDGAEFAVHSWMDDYGREAGDFAATAPVNRAYLDYYQEMGMAAEDARAFYDMTNSVPHAEALWLTAQDMRGWVATDEGAIEETIETAPKLAYLGLPHLDFGAASF